MVFPQHYITSEYTTPPSLLPRSEDSPKKGNIGISLVVQWLRLHTSIAGGTGTNPGQGTKIPHASWYGQKKKKENPKVI